MADTKKIKKCPHCFREIANDEAGFLIHADGARFQSPALGSYLSPKTDTVYEIFWSSMGIPEEQIDSRRIIIDNDSITELNQELMSSGRDLAAKRYNEESCGYTFQVDEGPITVFSNTMVCPFCHNILPHHFFKYDMIRIGLAGSVASGKTVYLCSLVMNGYEAMQRENLFVRSSAGSVVDDYKLEMDRNADRLYLYGICPESTSKTFRKPLFLEMTYRIDDKVLPLIVAIYDVAGELLGEAVGNGRTGFVRHMDGYIYLVDPAQMHLEHSLITSVVPDESTILSGLHVMTRQEQSNIQRLSNENGKQLMNQDDFLIASKGGAGYLTERRVETVMDNFRSMLGEPELSRKYMALTIAKSDLLEDLGEILEYTGSSLLFERNQPGTGFINTDHHFLRQDILKQIFDQKVFRLQRNLADYKESSLFAMSALGCETKEEMDEFYNYTTSRV